MENYFINVNVQWPDNQINKWLSQVQVSGLFISTLLNQRKLITESYM